MSFPENHVAFSECISHSVAQKPFSFSEKLVLFITTKLQSKIMVLLLLYLLRDKNYIENVLENTWKMVDKSEPEHIYIILLLTVENLDGWWSQ